jgi:hypothetical protein
MFPLVPFMYGFDIKLLEKTCMGVMSLVILLVF